MNRAVMGAAVVLVAFLLSSAPGAQLPLSLTDRVEDIHGPGALVNFDKIEYSLNKRSKKTGDVLYGETYVKDVSVPLPNRCFRTILYWRTFQLNFSNLNAGDWDSMNGDSYTGGILVFTLLHELYHSCTAETEATLVGNSCQHIAIEFSSNQEACKAVTDFVDSAPPDDLATPEDEEADFFSDNQLDTDFMKGLCAGIDQKRKEFNTAENFLLAQACTMVSPPPLLPISPGAPAFCATLRLPSLAELSASGVVLPACEACSQLP